jgi:hypothetical protein
MDEWLEFLQLLQKLPQDQFGEAWRMQHKPILDELARQTASVNQLTDAHNALSQAAGLHVGILTGVIVILAVATAALAWHAWRLRRRMRALEIDLHAAGVNLPASQCEAEG